MNDFNKLLNDIKDLEKKIDGAIDGHAWGEQEYGVKKVSISDLEDIQDDLRKILKKHDPENFKHYK